MRSKVLWLLWLGVAAGASACSEAPPAAPPKPICDGPPDLRLGFRVVPPLERVTWGAQVLHENGSYFLFVSGDCNYWVRQTQDRWADVRSGRLDEEQALDLSEALHYGRWAEFGGLWEDLTSVIADGPAWIFHDATSAVFCLNSCEGTDLPPEFAEMKKQAVSWTDRLWQEGTSVGGPLRLTAVRLEEGATPLAPPSAWPVPSVSLAGISISEGESALQGYGEAVLITEGVDELREIRRMHRDVKPPATFWYNYIPFDEAGAFYRACYRDTVPFENEYGLVPYPGEQ